jgi:hypothetical protein
MSVTAVVCLVEIVAPEMHEGVDSIRRKKPAARSRFLTPPLGSRVTLLTATAQAKNPPLS